MKERTNRKIRTILDFSGEVRIWSLCLMLTLILPLSLDSYPGASGRSLSLFFWELLGVIDFAPMLQIVFPGIMGMAWIVFAQFNSDRGLLAIVVTLTLLVSVFILQIDPSLSLGDFRLWVVFPGHRLMLFLGCISCAVAAELTLSGRSGVSWGTMGTALIVAYMLTPNIDGGVPIIESLQAVLVQSDAKNWPFAHFRLVIEIGLAIGAGLTLGMLGTATELHRQRSRYAVIIGWLMRGLIPSAIFPLLVDYSQGNPDGFFGLVMVRNYLIFVSFFAIFPVAVSCILEGVARRTLDEGSGAG